MFSDGRADAVRQKHGSDVLDHIIMFCHSEA